MRTEIKALHQRLKNTVIYVTHDQIEAMTLADRIVVMNAGKIEQVGKPLALYDRPANLFVAGFIGSPAMNFISGAAVSDGTRLVLKTDSGAKFPLPAVGVTPGKGITLGIRPEHVVVSPNGPVTMNVDVVEPTGAETHFYSRVDDAPFCVAAHHRLDITAGQAVNLEFPQDRVHVFDTQTGSRIN